MDVRDSGAPLRRPDPAPGRPAGAGRRRRFVDRRAAAEAALPPRTNALTTKDTKRTKEKRRRSGEVPSRLSAVGAASPPRTNALTTKDTKRTKEKARRKKGRSAQRPANQEPRTKKPSSRTRCASGMT